MELERVRFALKSYLRTRLAKIERHLLYIVEKDCSELLSEAEMQFAFKLYESRKDYFKQTFFEKIPAKLNCLEEEPIDNRISKCFSSLMSSLLNCVVTAPNTNEFVFVRMLKAYESVTLLDEIEVQLLENQIYFLPY